MAERVNQHKNPIIGGNIKRLRKEQKMKLHHFSILFFKKFIYSPTPCKTTHGRKRTGENNIFHYDWL